MKDLETRRPPVPSPAERAKTIATRGGQAVLLPSAERTTPAEARIEPVLHHVHGSASVSVLLPDDAPLTRATATADGGQVAVMFELTDRAPVDLREPIRGLLWITGWLRLLDDKSGRARAVSIADARPDPRLLDVGHGLSVLRLTPASLVLADAEGTHSLRPHMFGAASADPFCEHEAQWLRHLERTHGDVITDLARHLPDDLRSGRIRPLGLDRYGLRLRVECDGAEGRGDHDVRLAFSRPVDHPHQLALEMRRLVGCPFRDRT
ncbi:uncharacterized protein DUF2470 [Prauserella shujinwangii]|uniref:Uncharacterized protein DUF2470 n=1 Tax=Prauserella shujinwangii TaxID=1453103 RepID=A0A2T0LVK6_9PSEU|nr:DUF2470 domain-containing protein [Prauserella shujinwangii]PRX47872.1 uncharacterized protein DUF2470 [Prauserella shujinwangii]